MADLVQTGTTAGGTAGAGAEGAVTSTGASGGTTTDTAAGAGAAGDASGAAASGAGQPDTVLGGADAGKSTGAAAADVEVKFPDGFKAEPELVSGFKSVAKDIGIKSEQAQKVANFYVKMQQEQAAKAEAQTKATLEGWKKAVSEDKEYGGAKLGENVQLAKDAYQKFASPELRSFFNETGLASHPEVVRLFYRLAKADAEPSVNGTGTAAPGRTAEDKAEARLRAMYPTMSPQGTAQR